MIVDHNDGDSAVSKRLPEDIPGRNRAAAAGPPRKLHISDELQLIIQVKDVDDLVVQIAEILLEVVVDIPPPVKGESSDPHLPVPDAARDLPHCGELRGLRDPDAAQLSELRRIEMCQRDQSVEVLLPREELLRKLEHGLLFRPGSEQNSQKLCVRERRCALADTLFPGELFRTLLSHKPEIFHFLSRPDGGEPTVSLF